jgi:SAM-dependent methyltransferase
MSDGAMTTQGCYLCDGETTQIEAGGLGYWICGSCGLVIRRDRHTDDQFIADTYGFEYYANPESYPQWDSDIHLEAMLRARVETVALLRPERGHLLDVGSGLGHFIAAAESDGWYVCGVEPSSYARSVAASRAASRVYPDLATVNAEVPFDCVTMWDVVEHDTDPLRLLAGVRDVMRPGALLAVSMPNRAGLEARLRGRSWRFFRPEFGHITHHTPHTLSRLLGRGGFEVEHVQTEGSLNIAGKLAAVLPGSASQILQRGVDRTVTSIGQGRNMTAYARRI